MIDRTKFKPQSWYVTFSQYVEIHYVNTRSFLNEIEEYLLSSRKDLESKFDIAKKGSDKYSYDDFLNSVEDDYYNYKVVYVELCLNSSFVSCTSMFEYCLKRICVSQEMEVGKTQKQVKEKSNLLRYHKYLTDYCKIDLTEVREMWNLILEYNRLRNAIAHDFSKDSTSSPELRAFIVSKSSHIEVKDGLKNAFYIKDKEFLIEYLNLTEKFLKIVLEKLFTVVR